MLTRNEWNRVLPKGVYENVEVKEVDLRKGKVIGGGLGGGDDTLIKTIGLIAIILRR